MKKGRFERTISSEERRNREKVLEEWLPDDLGYFTLLYAVFFKRAVNIDSQSFVVLLKEWLKHQNLHWTAYSVGLFRDDIMLISKLLNDPTIECDSGVTNLSNEIIIQLRCFVDKRFSRFKPPTLTNEQVKEFVDEVKDLLHEQ